MNEIAESLMFTVDLTREVYQLAEKFSREQIELGKIRQVYLNTLAVYAVNFYCQCLEVETELEKSESWNLAMRTLMDVADLQIKGLGKLECRPVLPGAKVCDLPPESLQERVGYVVVEINQETKQAKLLGFSKIASSVLEISSLQSLERLIEQFPEAKETEIETVKLLAWFQGNFEKGWQVVQELISLKRKPAFRFTSNKQERAKLIDLGIEIAGQPVVLIITIQENNEQDVSIRSQVYPTDQSTTLPPSLKMSVLSETGDVFKEVIARSADEFIQYQFEAQLGDKFGIELALGEARITEHFQL